VQVNAISSDAKRRKYEKIKWTLKVYILGTAWQIQLQFGIGGASPRGNLHRKIHMFLFRECIATDVW